MTHSVGIITDIPIRIHDRMLSSGTRSAPYIAYMLKNE